MRKLTQTWGAVAGGYFSYMLLVSLWLGLKFEGLWYLSAFVFLLFITPILDATSSKDYVKFRVHDFSAIQKKLLRLAPFFFIVGYIAFVFFYLHAFVQMTLWERVWATLSLGATCSIMITAAHELIHKNIGINRLFARAGLMLAGYMHFEIFHLVGHHRDAATKFDNHTAWENESLYTYIYRTMKDAFTFCRNFEKQRLMKRGLRSFSPRNRMIWFTGLPALLAVLVAILFGFSSLTMLVGQAAFGIYALEAVSFIEHYGLLREQNLEGKYLSMNEEHSWNSYHRFSNYISFMLQRHADHHTNAAKDYFLLEVSDRSPELPFGYPTMIGIAAVPPLWRAMINPSLKKASRKQNLRPLSLGT